MKIFLSILGYIIGIFLGITLLAMFSAGSDSDLMGGGNSFIIGNIFGIICAIIGYNIGKKKTTQN